MATYKIYLDPTEMNAIEWWRGRNEWATASAFHLDTRPHEKDGAPTSGIFLDSDEEAREWKEACELDAEGGHSMFFGVTERFRVQLQDFWQLIAREIS